MSKYGPTKDKIRINELEKDKLNLNKMVGALTSQRDELKTSLKHSERYSIIVTGLFVLYVVFSFIL